MRLRADIAIISDTDQFGRGMPGITTGLRGLVYAEIFLTGPAFDLHSGQFGGAGAKIRPTCWSNCSRRCTTKTAA